MRLPQPLLSSQYFIFSELEELLAALGNGIDAQEFDEINRLAALRLPPITSVDTLSTMLGINQGLIWALQNRSHKYYRTFEIKKGKGTRRIDAPRIALKIIQKWISWHFQAAFSPPDHVYGFVRGKSHILAAASHCNAHWVYSIDIKDFFPSTPSHVVSAALIKFGYGASGSDLITKLCCLRGSLAQGAPSSPVISNICFSDVDLKLKEIAVHSGARITRYADDIVFSGKGDFDQDIATKLSDVFKQTPWRISEKKTHLSVLPNRLKVHGLLVHGDTIRLTKGYRNKMRTFKYLLDKGRIKNEDYSKILGHIQYQSQIKKFQ